MNDALKVSYLCRGDRKNTYLAFFIFLGIAVLGMLALFFQMTSPIVGQAIVFISLIVAAYIFIRYIGTAYRYDIVSEEDGDYLLVVRVQGKKNFTQRKLALSALSAVMEMQSSPNAPKEHPKLPVANYSAHLLADSYTLLYFEGDDPSLIRINAEEEFLAILASYISAEPENLAEENEND
ncbi:MAG: hypothetical protein IKM00_07460 [Clostridia bacterium]|nr:hypothetical protein [Clostridia bacterium]